MKTCCGDMRLMAWYPDGCSDCQQMHWAAGERYMCKNCGETIKVDRESYHEWLASNQWQEIREEVLNRDGNVCRDCHLTAEEVHHLNYDDILDTDTMVPLCTDCHRRRHNFMTLEELERFKTIIQNERRNRTRR